jgi:hypothetical protein
VTVVVRAPAAGYTMVMAVSWRRIGDEAHYVEATARMFGWHTCGSRIERARG